LYQNLIVRLEFVYQKTKKGGKTVKMSGTELIMGMEEVINYLKELEAENKKLKEEDKDQQFIIVNKVARREKLEYQPKGSRIDPEGLHDYMKEEIDKLKQQLEAFESLTGIKRDVVCRHNDPDDDDYYTYKTFEEYEEEIGELEDEKEEEEEEDVVFLYPNDEGSIQDPENPEDYYSFGKNCKSKIGDNSTMKRILKNGSIKDCVVANAYCMFVKGRKLYYQGRSSRGPTHVRTIKGEKTTMEFPY